MASEIKLPELGENLEEGEVVDVLVAAGDTVREGQALLEIEAEKSTVEVPSPMAGRIAQVLVKKGEKVKVNQAICTIEAGEKSGASKVSPVREESKKRTESEPRQAKQRTGRPDAADSAPASAAEAKGSPKGDGRKNDQAEPRSQTRSTVPAPGAAPQRVVPAGPATRRLARELGIDLSQVPGSAPSGRVTEEDVKAFVQQLAAGTASRPGGMPVPPLPDFERWGPVERQPLEPVRRKTTEQMSVAWSVVPHVTQHDQADITELDAFRKQQDKNGPKLTVTAFALKTAAILLKQMPQFNASLDTAAHQLVSKRYYHIGVAVDTDRGLLVPVLRDVDKKSVLDLAKELTELAEKARQKKISAEEMRGGTFTITNLGGIGGTGFTPIVNYPEVAILGLARARLQPVVRHGDIVPRLILPLSLSYDHRVIDGAAAARFTRRFAEMLENPLLIMLHA